MPRPKGSKNVANHNAGGARLGAGRPKKQGTAGAKNGSSIKDYFGASTKAPATVPPTSHATDEDGNVPSIDTPSNDDVPRRELERQHQELLRKLKDSLSDGSFDSLMDELEDDDDDDNDDNEESDEEEETRSGRLVYKPPVGSPVHNALDEVKNQVKLTAQNKQHPNYLAVHKRHLHWIQPSNLKNPLGGSCSLHDPSSYYRYNLREVYVWLPFYQYKNFCQLSKCACTHCGAGLQSHQYDWRPMFYFDRIVWVVHRRFKCSNPQCQKTIAAIHPKFLDQLPALVQRQFEFLTTTNRQVGIHKEMMYQFLELITNRIQFGTFAASFNRLYRRQCWEQQLSYYEHFTTSRDNCSVASFANGNRLPEPFSAFDSAGQYNGIRLSKKTMKSCFLQVARKGETHKQNSFQFQCDEGASADHAFKFPKTVKAPGGRQGQAFGSTYTIMAHIGLVNAVRMTHTKSPLELKPLLEEYKVVRHNAGAPPLAIRYTDDVGGDGNVWREVFHDELTEGVLPSDKMTRLGVADCFNCITEDSYVLINSFNEAQVWVEFLRDSLGTKLTKNDRVWVGIDTEFHDGASDTDVLAVSFPGDVPVAVFHLSAMNIRSADAFPPKLKELLQEANLYPCARNVGTDASRLRKLGVRLPRQIEIGDLATELEAQPKGTSLAALAHRYLGMNVDKQHQRSDFSQNPLPVVLQRYAAFDPFLHRSVAEELWKRIVLKRSSNEVFVEPPTSLSLVEGKPVHVYIGSLKAADGVVVFASCDGQARVFGENLLIGKGKAMVKLTNILRPQSKIPTMNREYNKEWPQNADLHWVWNNSTERMIAVKTSNLRIAVDSREVVAEASCKPFLSDPAVPSSSETTFNDTGERAHSTVVVPGAVDDSFGSIQPAVSPPTSTGLDHAGEISHSSLVNNCVVDDGSGLTEPLPLGGQLVDDVDEVCGDNAEDDLDGWIAGIDCDELNADIEVAAEDSPEDGIRCRQQEDLWHQLKNIPLAKTMFVQKTLIMRLLIHATYIFVKEDFDQMREYLRNHRNITDMDEILDHFCYHRHFWRERVRMPTYKPEQHARNIRWVHDVVENDVDLKRVYDEEMKKYFDSFERKCAEGLFAELTDVKRFIRIARDSYGFDLWIRLSGSTRCENFHMLIRRAMAPWGIGVELAHYILLYIAYKYNVNCGIKRMGNHDFGHWHLDIMDSLQAVIQDIYNVAVFPRHVNVSLSNPIEGFVAVGIGPLSLSKRFVTPGPPSPRLKRDTAFLARRMGVQLPPLQPSGKAEFKIMKKFWINHPRLTRSNCEELAALFLEKSDGVDVFPKLPSMFPPYFKKTQRNNELMKLRGRLETSTRRYCRLMAHLTNQRVPADEVSSGTIARTPTIKRRSAATEDRLVRQHKDLKSPIPVRPWVQDGILAKLTKAEYARLLDAVSRGSPSDIVAQKSFGRGTLILVKRSSLDRLLDGRWLNDETINYFCRVICKQLAPDSFAFSTFFFTRLAVDDGCYKYQNVASWTASRNNAIDIFNQRMVIFPINLDQYHWVIAVAYMVKQVLLFWDSKGSSGERQIAHIMRYLEDEHLDKKGCNLPDGWSSTYDSRVLQKGGVHCGAFVCTAIYQLLRGQSLNFVEKQMLVARQRLALWIVESGQTGTATRAFVVNNDTVGTSLGINGQSVAQKRPALGCEPMQNQNKTAALVSQSSNNHIMKVTKRQRRGEEGPFDNCEVMDDGNRDDDQPLAVVDATRGVSAAALLRTDDRWPSMCFYYPVCSQPTNVCGGARQKLCQNIDEDHLFQQMSREQFLKAKRAAKARLRAVRERHNYHQNKKAQKKS